MIILFRGLVTDPWDRCSNNNDNKILVWKNVIANTIEERHENIGSLLFSTEDNIKILFSPLLVSSSESFHTGYYDNSAWYNFPVANLNTKLCILSQTSDFIIICFPVLQYYFKQNLYMHLSPLLIIRHRTV